MGFSTNPRATRSSPVLCLPGQSVGFHRGSDVSCRVKKLKRLSSQGFMRPATAPLLALISLGRCPILTGKASHKSGGRETHGLEATAGLYHGLGG